MDSDRSLLQVGGAVGVYVLLGSGGQGSSGRCCRVLSWPDLAGINRPSQVGFRPEFRGRRLLLLVVQSQLRAVVLLRTFIPAFPAQ
jgi:hypothetical protein